MWVEETLWDWLKWLTGLIASLRVIHRLEAWIVGLPPYAMMAVFLLPMTILIPFKIAAVYWMTRGYYLASLLTILAAKVLGTAVVARMYVVCKPQLMTIVWFKWLHDRLIEVRRRLHAALESLPLYCAARAQFLAMKLAVKRLLMAIRNRWRLKVRWRAFLRWYRRLNSSARGPD